MYTQNYKQPKHELHEEDLVIYYYFGFGLLYLGYGAIHTANGVGRNFGVYDFIVISSFEFLLN